MRKKLWTIGIVSAVVFISGITIYINYNGRSSEKKLNTKFSEGAIENPTGIIGRLQWEFNRLKDPLTGKIPDGIRGKELAFAQSLPKESMLKSSGWISRGPYNVGGRTRAAALDVNNENIILAGGVSGGMWRSTNGGQSWVKVTATNQLHNVTCIAQDKRSGKTNTWYYGAGEVYGNSAGATGAGFYGDGIYKSVDNGITWAPLISTVSNTPQTANNFDLVWDIVTDPANMTEDVVYVSTKSKVFRSNDGGNSWSVTIECTGSYVAWFTDLAITSAGVVYAAISDEGNKDGLWRSPDGITWTNVLSSDFSPLYDRMVMGINPSNQNEMYILVVTPNHGQVSTNFLNEQEWSSLWKYTYISGDGSGANGTWTDLSANIPVNGASSFDNFYAQGSYNMVVAVKPDDPNVVIIGGTNLYRSTDGFTTPNNVRQIGGYEIGTTFPDFHIYPNHHPDQHVVLFLPSNPNVLISATDGGVFRTDSCMALTVNWQRLNNGYVTTQFYTVTINEYGNDDIVLGGLQDNGNFFTNNDNFTSSWVMPLNGDGAYAAISNDGNTYYLSIQQGRIYKMTLDNSGNATAFARMDPIGIPKDNYEFINPFVLDPNNNDLMYIAGGTKIWRNDSLSSIPLANTYDSISLGWTQLTNSTNNSYITCVAISKNPANILYYGTGSRFVYKVENANTGNPLHVRINNFPTIFPSANVSCIAVDPRDANKLIIVNSNYNVYSLFYTADGGSTWSKISGNLEQNQNGSGNGPSCRWASILPWADSTLYYVGTSVGLFYTSHLQDTSTVWTQTAPGTIGNVVVDMIKSRASDGYVAVATHGNGIYSINLEHTQVEKNSTGNTIKVSLFPNPATNQIQASFIAINSGRVNTAIYDGSGRIVRKETRELNMGEQRFEMDISGLAPGIYYYFASVGKDRVFTKFVKAE